MQQVEAQGAENQAPEGLENEAEAPEGQQPEGTEGEAEEKGEDPYAPIAQKLGWVPKEQFSGPAEQWKPAEQFILDGRDIQRETARELKTVRAQLDTIAKTNASIVEQQIQERLGELAGAHERAVEEGDSAQAIRIAEQMQAVKARVPGASPQGPSPEAQAFAERNAAWFQKPGYEYATARAVEICNTLAGQGYTDHGTQLRIAEQRLRQEMPEVFGGQRNGKPPASVNAPSGRPAGPSNRAKTFSDLPKQAQDLARDMAARGVIKSVDDYTKKYFENLEAKG